jgi:hypothetical protein
LQPVPQGSGMIGVWQLPGQPTMKILEYIQIIGPVEIE